MTAEWELHINGMCDTHIGGDRLSVWYDGENWIMNFDPVTGSYLRELSATDSGGAKSEALDIVSEWLRGLAKKVDELRNSEPATPGEG